MRDLAEGSFKVSGGIGSNEALELSLVWGLDTFFTAFPGFRSGLFALGGGGHFVGAV